MPISPEFKPRDTLDLEGAAPGEALVLVSGFLDKG